MSTRKLQATGGSSLTLTLPKDWVRMHSLQGKDSVVVRPAGESLLITPESSRSANAAHVCIDISKYTADYLLRITVATYIAGANSIEYRADVITASRSREIKQVVTRFLFGFEVTDESAEHVIVSNIFDSEKSRPQFTTKQIASIATRMYAEVLGVLKTGNRQAAQDIITRDDEVDKMLIAVKRQFQQMISGQVPGDATTASMYRSVSIQLERIADHAVRIAEIVCTADDTVTLSSYFDTMQQTAHDLLESCKVLIDNPDETPALQLLDAAVRGEEVMKQSKRLKQSYEGAIIEDSLDRLCGCVKNIAEHIIEYHYAKQ